MSFLPKEVTIYYSPKKGRRKPVLVVDTGKDGGEVHVYELKRSLPYDQLGKVLEGYGESIVWKVPL